jgi:hypothetical protein
MSFKNPTPIQVGMTCNLVGRQYRVAGRMVLGMEEGGETYYWNEFHLVSGEGRAATLVFEETDRGGQWRLFTMFDPVSPLSAAEAAGKRVGDTITLGGTTMRVTLVDESRVYHIEGEAPEGVELADLARYFNAEAGGEMIVVSWTGDEVEFYRGMDVEASVVAAAFGLPMEALGRQRRSGSSVSIPPEWTRRTVIALMAGVVGFSAYSSCAPSRRAVTVSKVRAPAPPLAANAIGKLEGATYRIRAHVMAEVAQAGLSYERHEYHLADAHGNQVLLVCGLKPGATEWVWLAPVEPPQLLTPYVAAAKRSGEGVELAGVQATVADLFRSTVIQVQSAEASDLTNGLVWYGFAARSAAQVFLARWTEGSITCYRGKTVPSKEVVAAFAHPLPTKNL